MELKLDDNYYGVDKICVHHTGETQVYIDKYDNKIGSIADRVKAIEENYIKEGDIKQMRRERCKNILAIYEDNRIDKINAVAAAEKEKMLAEDECVKILLEAVEKVNKEIEPVTINFNFEVLAREETKNKIAEAQEKYKKEKDAVRAMIKEVEAMLDIAETFEQAMIILQDYEIINRKTGKIKLD